MLKALLKINIGSTFRMLPGRGKKRSKLSAALYALLLVYVVVMFGQCADTWDTDETEQVLHYLRLVL